MEKAGMMLRRGYIYDPGIALVNQMGSDIMGGLNNDNDDLILDLFANNVKDKIKEDDLREKIVIIRRLIGEDSNDYEIKLTHG